MSTLQPLFLGGDSRDGGRSVNDSIQWAGGNDSGSQQQQIGIKTYSRDQGRKGKASIDDIVSGKAVVRD